MRVSLRNSINLYFKCADTIFAISNIDKDFLGNTFDSAASGEMVLPALNLCFLMYAQIFFVTSMRDMLLPPQIEANSALSVFGAKRPFPAFLRFAAFLFPAAFFAVLPAARLAAFSVFKTYCGVFFFVVLTVVFAFVFLLTFAVVFFAIFL